jgi:hypothetical protein
MAQSPVLLDVRVDATEDPRHRDLDFDLDHRNRPPEQDRAETRSRFPVAHLMSLVVGLLVSGLVLVPLSNDATAVPPPKGRPAPKTVSRPPRSLPVKPAPIITVYIVDSQRMADEIEAEASLGANRIATVGATTGSAPRQYVLGGTPEADAEIEELVMYLEQINVAAMADAEATTYRIVDLRGRR